MNQYDMRQRLIYSAINVVANFGIHKTTTKLIAAEAGLNEVYIYRMFKNKDNLLESAFTALDQEFASAMLVSFPPKTKEEFDIEERCWKYFLSGWRFLLSNKEKCSFFIKYYHAQYFDLYPIEL